MNTFGGGRVHLAEFGVQGRDALVGRTRPKSRPKSRIGRRALEQSVHQAHQIERRPGDRQNPASTAADLRDRPIRHLDEFGHAERGPGLDHVDEMVPHGRSLLRTRFRRADIHAAVDLHRIDAENLRVQTSS